jgi:hypothetical protein
MRNITDCSNDILEDTPGGKERGIRYSDRKRGEILIEPEEIPFDVKSRIRG